jgi:hypothetical protein
MMQSASTDWKSGNTVVQTDLDNVSRVFLYENQIATIGENFIELTMVSIRQQQPSLD